MQCATVATAVVLETFDFVYDSTDEKCQSLPKCTYVCCEHYGSKSFISRARRNINNTISTNVNKQDLSALKHIAQYRAMRVNLMLE